MSKKKLKKKKNKRSPKTVIITVIIIIVIAALAAGGLVLFFKYRSFSGYDIKSSVDVSTSSETISLTEYSDGYILCAGDAITYFTDDGVVWSESLEITQPIVDVCGDYAAVGDMEGSDVYIYDNSGLAGHVTTEYSLLDIEVSEAGVVAMATNSSSSNYIELKDREGNELVTAKSIFSSSGYLIDIALSDDGTGLAAAFLYTADGALESKILFYDFSGDSDSDDVLVGGFNQYTDTLITSVKYMKDDVVCAIGDNAITFYDFSGTPEIISEELDLEWEIHSLYANDDYILLVASDTSGSATYTGYVYNNSGALAAAVSLETIYNNAVLAERNILLYSSSDCSMYSFDGQLKFSCSFEESVDCMLSCGSRNRLLYIASGNANFIKLR